MNVNLVTVAGRLTRDPQLRFLPNQTAIANFGIAINEKFKENEKTHFVDVVAFGKTAELINQHFAKGKEIFVAGRLSYSQWDDKANGQKRSKLEVVAEQFQFVGPPNGEAPRPGRPSDGGNGGGGEFKDDDVPF